MGLSYPRLARTAGSPAGSDACVAGPGAPPHPSIDGIVVAPPAPSHRPPGTPAFGPSAWSPSDRYSPLVEFVVNAILHALQISFFMLWEVLWPLAFGFLLSAIIQTVVSKRAVASALGKPDLKGFVLACGFGAASSSCSYAAVAVGRALLRRGASFVNAIIFEFASTNLVFELGLVLLILLGWQFVAAEFAGGLLMAVILWIIFKLTLRKRMVDDAKRQAERGVFGTTHEAHGEMD